MPNRCAWGALMLGLALAACAPRQTPAPGAPPPQTPTPAASAPAILPQPGQFIPVVPTAEATRGWVVLPYGSPQTPSGTSFFPLSTPPFPGLTADPATGCAAAFPLEAVRRAVQGGLSMEQVAAAFGPVLSVSGRPPRYRFQAGGCLLLVTAGMRSAQRAELRPYFSLGELVARLGEPEAVAAVADGLRLPGREHLALLYPAEGLIALFEGRPGSRGAPIPRLVVVQPGEVAALWRELGAGAEPVEGWEVPPP